MMNYNVSHRQRYHLPVSGLAEEQNQSHPLFPIQNSFQTQQFP